MEIKEFNGHTFSLENDKVANTQRKFIELLSELRLRNLPDDMLQQINGQLDSLNGYSENGKAYKRALEKAQRNILSLLEKNLKVVAKNHYRNMGIALGMGAFGVPMGLAFAMTMGNYGFMGIGIPIGLAIGLVLGKKKDQKAEEEDRQLSFDLSI